MAFSFETSSTPLTLASSGPRTHCLRNGRSPCFFKRSQIWKFNILSRICDRPRSGQKFENCGSDGFNSNRCPGKGRGLKSQRWHKPRPKALFDAVDFCFAEGNCPENDELLAGDFAGFRSRGRVAICLKIVHAFGGIDPPRNPSAEQFDLGLF